MQQYAGLNCYWNTDTICSITLALVQNNDFVAPALPSTIEKVGLTAQAVEVKVPRL